MIVTDLFESHQTCPKCGGPAFSDLVLAEKKDACYSKVRSRYKVWPSAYASGALVQCRKKGAANWGNKSEGVMEMDKSQTPPGRDGSNDSDAGKKEYTAKATTAKKVAKDAEKILNKELNKKQGMAEAINPDITNPEFSHQQQIGDYLYVARYWSKGLKITAYDGAKKIGHAELMYQSAPFDDFADPKTTPKRIWLESEWTHVDPKYQRQGIMGTMYAYAKMLGNSVKPSQTRSDDAKAAWKSWRDAGDAQYLTREGVAEGSNDTIYPNAEVIKSKNGKPVGEIYQDEYGWGCFHYRADRGYDMIDSREDAIQELKDLHAETGRSRPDYTIKGVAEGSGPKEKQKTPYRDINSAEYRAAAEKQKQQMAKDKLAEPGKKLLAKKGVAEAVPGNEYSRVLTALRLYYPRFEMEELNTPEWYRVIANKANVTPEYAGQVINDFVRASQPDEEENFDWMDDTNDVREGVAEGGYGHRNPDLMSPGDYDRYQQDQMDHNKRDFKRREHEAEWEQEKAYSEKLAARDAGTWYIRINGRLLRDRQGQPFTFRGKAAANRAAVTMMQKPFNAGKQFSLTTTPADRA